ncbi:MAG: Na/Pi cotransporter family protein [Clostridia bacterium]|nr:Na/Pi cotransporter family protein [Clostridia bacterium]
MDTQYLSMAIGLLGGLGLLLFGMKLMGEGLETAAGPNLRKMIEKLTTNKYMGALVGLVVTAVIQSSSATTVMVVGFVNANLMNLAQAVGVIMGANIGTTVTGLIIAINLKSIAPIAIFAGVIMICFIKKDMIRHIGQIIVGFGLLFLGMSNMETAMKPLSTMTEFTDLMVSMTNPLLGVLVGALFTALIQSSSASVGVLQALGAAGAIGLGNAIYIVYGQNIGTCITAMLSSMGSSRTARRTAVVHLIFNVIGTALFVVFTMLFPYTQFIESLAPNNIMLQISLAHSIFNIVGTAIMLPLSNWLIKIACLIVKGEDEKVETKRLAYLDERVLKTPPMAVTVCIKEIERMGGIAKKTYKKAMDSLLAYDKTGVAYVMEHEEIIDYLNQGITGYITKINELDMSDSDIRRVSGLYRVISDIERIGDHCENIAELLQRMLDLNKRFTEEAQRDIKDLSDRVYDIFNKTMILFSRGVKDVDEIMRIARMEESIDVMTDSAKERHIKRLKNGTCSATSSTVFMDLLTNLERIADHANNIAFSLIKEKKYIQNGELIQQTTNS